MFDWELFIKNANKHNNIHEIQILKKASIRKEDMEKRNR